MESTLIFNQDFAAKHILIVLLGAIGDVTRAFPLVGRIKKTWPKSQITWAVESASATLVKQCCFVDKVIEFKRKEGLRGFYNFIQEIRHENYDLALDLQRHLKSGLVSYFSKSPNRVGFHFKNSRELNWLLNNFSINPVAHRSDKVEQYMKFGDFLGLDSIGHPYDFGLKVSDAEKENLLKKIRTEFPSDLNAQGKRVLLLIGSTWESRKWPSAHYASLADDLNETFGFTSYLVGSKEDQEKADEILKQAKYPLIDLTGKTSLSEFKTLCTLAHFAVGSDSGPLHIASAQGLKVISLWGPTSPYRSRPYGNFENVIQSPVGCAECYFSKCPGLDNLCLKEISPTVVSAFVRNLI